MKIQILQSDIGGASHDSVSNSCIVATALRRIYGSTWHVGYISASSREEPEWLNFDLDAVTQKNIKAWTDGKSVAPWVVEMTPMQHTETSAHPLAA